MNQLVNESEQFVHDICRKSFLSLWSYANPLGKASKELCDILIVCDPDVIVISVKDVRVTDSGNISTDWTRWKKRAIDASIKQIYGAERWLEGASHVVRSDGTVGIALPKTSVRRVHRIAVALGGEGKTPLRFGDFGKGYVHVFDKISVEIIMGEVDTIEDFIQYLMAKEDLLRSGRKTLFNGGEEDLLALYLHEGRQFPNAFDLVVVDDDLWAGFKNSEEYKAKKEADEISYNWDRLIELLCNDILRGNLEFGPDLNESEIAVRTMARENRFGRRLTGKSFMEFYELACQKTVRARMAPGNSDVTYVFLAMPHGEDRQYRVAELFGRCFVACGLNQERKVVVGLATEQYEEGKGFSFDLVHIHKETWSEEDRNHFSYLQTEFGYFKNPKFTESQEDEYPINVT